MAASAKDSLVGAAGTTSGFLSFLGSYTVCHNLCMLAIGALAAVGITASGLPFLFLQDYAVYLWVISVIALAVSLLIYFKMAHKTSRNLIIANAGFILAGVPFDSLGNYEQVLQATGVLLVIYALASFAYERLLKKRS